MHGLDKHYFWVRINVLKYFPSNALALGLSVLAHFFLISLVYFSGTSGSKHNALPSAGLSISLIPIDFSILTPPSLKEGLVNDLSRLASIEPSSDTTSLSSKEASKVDSLFPLISAVKPHYFLTKELTRKPLIARDIPSDTLLIVPGVPEQAATLRIQVNEYGDVDKVIVETSLLPQAAQQLVVEEFEKIKFHPGEINGIAVKSELKIEIMLEDPNLKNSVIK